MIISSHHADALQIPEQYPALFSNQPKYFNFQIESYSNTAQEQILK